VAPVIITLVKSKQKPNAPSSNNDK
jgi:hypothetical protein